MVMVECVWRTDGCRAGWRGWASGRAEQGRAGTSTPAERRTSTGGAPAHGQGAGIRAGCRHTGRAHAGAAAQADAAALLHGCVAAPLPPRPAAPPSSARRLICTAACTAPARPDHTLPQAGGLSRPTQGRPAAPAAARTARRARSPQLVAASPRARSNCRGAARLEAPVPELHNGPRSCTPPPMHSCSPDAGSPQPPTLPQRAHSPSHRHSSMRTAAPAHIPPPAPPPPSASSIRCSIPLMRCGHTGRRSMMKSITKAPQGTIVPGVHVLFPAGAIPPRYFNR